ncbi:MAG: hypothetical protein AB3N63_15375 [Puniceicoccaceae bacterium]
MNKTLLLIICDFLLISILALVEFKPEVEVDMVDEQELRDQAAEEMLELLQLSLEHENSQRKEVEDLLADSREQLDETETVLENTRLDLDQTLSAKEQMEDSLEDTRERLDITQASLESTQVTLNLTQEEKEALESSLNAQEKQSQRLQTELREQLDLVAQKEAALETAEENIHQLTVSGQQMETQIKILDTEKQMLTQNLVTAEAEVERARLDAERAMTRSENLAAGVSELAASSTALKEEIRQTQSLSMNAIYKQFEDNRIFIRFEWNESNLFSNSEQQSVLQTLLLKTSEGTFAVFATANSPLQVYDPSRISAVMKIGDKSYRVQNIGYLDSDSRIACVRVSNSIVEQSGLVSFDVSEEPLRFSTAVLVSDDREIYGEIPIRVPPGEPGFLEVESKLFNRLLGEFSPTPGDYVFSMTGQLTGIAVSNNRVKMIENPSFGNFRDLR